MGLKKKLINYTKKIIAQLLFTSGILVFIRYIRIVFFKKPRLTVLCYHRITDEPYLISPQCITAPDFSNQLKFFYKNFDIWSVAEIKSFLSQEKKLRKDTVVFTFDDGYLDNYTDAYFSLLEYDISGCFFISSLPLLQRQPYWIDILSNSLSLLMGRKMPANNNFPEEFLTHLNSFISADQRDKTLLAKNIFSYLNTLSCVNRKKLLNQLISLLTEDEKMLVRQQNSVVTLEHVKLMQEAGQVIGAHSLSHSRFANLTEQELCDEISGSIEMCRSADLNIRYFAYPFGKLADIGQNRNTINQQLKLADIDLAFTTVDASIKQDDDPYLLPRKVMSPQSIAQINLKMELMAWR